MQDAPTPPEFSGANRASAPKPPRNLDPLAAEILQKLVGRDAAAEIVMGGYLALQHYLDYRTTRDIHAWWRSAATAEAERLIREVMRQVGVEHGFSLAERRFGDTLSFELLRGDRKEFSFQIAIRSLQLEAPAKSAWPPVLIETLRDNIGSKMNALVDRGAPRDLLDIMNVVSAGLVTVSDCWFLWERKNPGASVEDAQRKVRHHLEGIESRRPLESIQDDDDRKAAANSREWYRTVFLTARR